MSDMAVLVFSLLTFLVAVPSAVKVFNWVATLYKGSIRLAPPMLFALSFIFLFSIGGLMGLVVGSAGTDIHVHDTHFVVSHFHYVMFGGTGSAFFGALHYWFPKFSGRLYNHRIATVAWALFFIGFNGLYACMAILGLLGMPRRYYDYLPYFTNLNQVATMASWILASGIFLLFGNLLWAMFRGAPAPGNPWNGLSLEWQLASPLPAENFAVEPVVTHGPYDYHEVEQG
jgi:cytochrome c oxidase subunit 1